MADAVQVYEGGGIVCQHCQGEGCKECGFRGECQHQYAIMNLDKWCGSVSFGNDCIVFWKPKDNFIREVARADPPFRLRQLSLCAELKIGIGEVAMRDLAVIKVEIPDDQNRLKMVVEWQR